MKTFKFLFYVFYLKLLYLFLNSCVIFQFKAYCLNFEIQMDSIRERILRYLYDNSGFLDSGILAQIATLFELKQS